MNSTINHTKFTFKELKEMRDKCLKLLSVYMSSPKAQWLSKANPEAYYATCKRIAKIADERANNIKEALKLKARKKPFTKFEGKKRPFVIYGGYNTVKG